MAYWQVRDGFNNIDIENIDKIQLNDILFLVTEGVFVSYGRCINRSVDGIKVDKWENLSLKPTSLLGSLERGNYSKKIALIKNNEKIYELLAAIKSLEVYKLRKMTITNFRLIEELEINFNEDVNVIIANNGAGKTTLLDAIAIGFGALVGRFGDGLSFKDSDLRINSQSKTENFMRIALESTQNVIWDSNKNRQKLSTKIKQSIPERYGDKELNHFVDKIIDSEYEGEEFEMPLVIYYKTNRAVFDAPMRKRNFKKEFSRFGALDGVLKRDANFHRLFQWFDAMENEERRGIQNYSDLNFKLFELEEVRNAIESMLPNFKNPRIKTNPLQFMIDRVEENGSITSLNIEQLSDGYRTILAMVMDISARMSQANPHLGNDSKAIILIDELDLHLHPKWQQTILSDLRRTFPNAQFIVTTHSVHILSSIKKEKLFILKDGQVEKTSLNTYGKSIDELLLGSFDMKSLRYPKVAQKIDRLQKLLYSDEYKEEEFLSELEGLEQEIGKDDIELLKLRLEKIKRDKNA